MADASMDVLTRVEARQLAHEAVMRTILEVLQMQGEKLDAILQAATIDPGPSPVAEALQQISLGLRAQTELLERLPEALASVIREEMAVDLDDVETEPAEGAFEREAAER